MMQEISAIVQRAVFTALENDNLLLTGLHARADENLPQLSFDGMTSQWRDRASLLVSHRVQFSVWGHLAGFADMETLSRRLSKQMETVEPAPLFLLRARLLVLESGLDAANRLWRQSVSFEIVTQGDARDEAAR